MMPPSRARKALKMRVLGIDPAASGPTGYAVVETDGRTCRSIHFGATLPAKRRADFGARLRQIHALMRRLVEEFSPDAVALESVFAALNMKTALKLAEVRGVVMLAAAQRNVPVHSYSPREVKSCVAGYGHASKQQMQEMVRAQLGLRETPQPADAADALAIALCHIHNQQARARIAAATAPAAARSPLPHGAGRSRSRAPRIQSTR